MKILKIKNYLGNCQNADFVPLNIFIPPGEKKRSRLAIRNPPTPENRKMGLGKCASGEQNAFDKTLMSCRQLVQRRPNGKKNMENTLLSSTIRPLKALLSLCMGEGGFLPPEQDLNMDDN